MTTGVNSWRECAFLLSQSTLTLCHALNTMSQNKITAGTYSIQVLKYDNCSNLLISITDHFKKLDFTRVLETYYIPKIHSYFDSFHVIAYTAFSALICGMHSSHLFKAQSQSSEMSKHITEKKTISIIKLIRL